VIELVIGVGIDGQEVGEQALVSLGQPRRDGDYRLRTRAGLADRVPNGDRSNWEAAGRKAG
jgi:hypothetical protein